MRTPEEGELGATQKGLMGRLTSAIGFGKEEPVKADEVAI